MKDLIDLIAIKVGVTYISDLHNGFTNENLSKGLFDDIKNDEFNIRQWNEAVAYITGEEKPFDSIEAAKLFLEEFLTRKK